MKKIKKVQGGDTIYSKKEKISDRTLFKKPTYEGTINRYKMKTPSGDIEQGKVYKKTNLATGEKTVTKKTGIIKKSQNGAAVGAKEVSLTKAQSGTSFGQKITSQRPKLGTKSVGKSYEKSKGESGKNAGKSDAGTMKPTYGGAKNGKSMKTCKGGC